MKGSAQFQIRTRDVVGLLLVGVLQRVVMVDDVSFETWADRNNARDHGNWIDPVIHYPKNRS